MDERSAASRSGRVRFAVLLGAFGFVCASGASADEPAASPRVIEEIVVTAQKKEEALQEVPISITALDGEFLKDAGVVGIHELVRYTPNVYYAANPFSSSIFIRGFGSPFVASAFDPTVSLVLDELSIPKDIYLSDPIYDVERFEVLRGPQGTLFGKNTPAGLFNVTTVQPSREFTGTLLGAVGTENTHRVEAGLGGPLVPFGDLAQFRLALLDSRQAEDVWNTKRREGEPGTDQRAGRLRLAVEPAADFDFVVTADRAITEAARTFSFQLHRIPEDSVAFLRQFDPEFEDDGLNHQNSQDGSGRLKRTTDRIQGNLHYSFGSVGPVRDAAVAAVIGYSAFESHGPIDNDFSPAEILPVPVSDLDYDQKSAEVRASGLLPGPFLGEIDLVLGFLLFDSSYVSDLQLRAGRDFEEWLLSPAGFQMATGSPSPAGPLYGSYFAALAALGLGPSPIPPILAGDGFHSFSDQGTTSEGIFGQAAWHLTEKWTASFGGRVTFEKKTADLRFSCFDPGVLCAAFGAQPFSTELDRRATNFSPKVTLQYFPFDSLSLFATRATGFKSGGYNNVALTTQDLEVKEEKTVSWEVGAKGTLFGDTLSYGATLFNMDVEDLQVQQFLGATTIVVRNAAGARSRGLELDFQWLTPYTPLSVRGAGALTDGKFKDFPNAPATRSSGANEQDLSGKRLPFSSERQLTVTPQLRFPFDGGSVPVLGSLLPGPLALTLECDVIYRSDLFLDIDLDPATHQGDYALVNGRLRLSGLSDALSLTLSAENMTDAKVLQFATDTPVFNGFMVFQEYGRIITAEVRYAW